VSDSLSETSIFFCLPAVSCVIETATNRKSEISVEAKTAALSAGVYLLVVGFTGLLFCYAERKA